MRSSRQTPGLRRVSGGTTAVLLATLAVAGCSSTPSSAPSGPAGGTSSATPTSNSSSMASDREGAKAPTPPTPIQDIRTPQVPTAKHTDSGAEAYSRYLIRLFYADLSRRDLADVRRQVTRPAESKGYVDAARAVRQLTATMRYQDPGVVSFDRVAVTSHQQREVVVTLALRTARGSVYDESGKKVLTLAPQHPNGQVLLKWHRADKSWRVVDFALVTAPPKRHTGAGRG